MTEHESAVQPAPEDGVAARNRLYWRCRRGMLELDLLLQGFMETGYDALTPAQREAFTELLDYPDQLLLEYLLGRMMPTDERLGELVTEIRKNSNGVRDD